MAAASADVDHLYECPVCMEIMIQPKLLQCAHSVCNSCMDKLTERGWNFIAFQLLDFTVSCVGSDVECPTCRHHSTVPHTGFPTNFQLSAIIQRHISEQEKQCHKCFTCDKRSASDDMIMCHSCGDMSLCLRCAFRSHEGHEREELQNHIGNQLKQLEQWRDDKLPILESLTLCRSTAVFNRCKALIDQQQTQQLKIGQRRREFEGSLGRLVDSSENELTASNGYKFDFASLETQLQAMQNEHKETVTKRQELADALSKMLLSGDVSDIDQICTTETGILLTDGQKFEIYSPSINTTQLIGIEMEDRFGFEMQALSDGRVMVAGGKNYPNFQSSPTLIIDLVSKQVVQGPPFPTARCGAGSVMINGEMYVCGGVDEELDALTSCDVYRNGQWTAIAAMKVPRSGHAVVALDGSLYAIGGLNNAVRALKSVEWYSPVTNTWQFVSPLNVTPTRPALHATAFNGCIYAAVRAGDSAKSCERYCPSQNKWETVAPMNKERLLLSLVPLGDKLYALGGDEEMSVESYDPEKNEWKLEDITLKTRCHKAVVADYHTD